MGIDGILSRSIGTIKSVAEKYADSDKGIIDYLTSFGKTASELVEAKDKLEKKLSFYESEFNNMKKKIKVITGLNIALQLLTLGLLVLLLIKR